MKKITLAIIGLMVVASCSNDKDIVEQVEAENLETQKLLSIEEVNRFIEGELKRTGDVDWTTAPSVVLWSAVMHGDEVLSVGYGDKGESFTEQRSPRLNSIKENIYALVGAQEGVTKSSTTVNEDAILNVVDIKVTQLKTISALQKADDIRYLEPIGYGSYLQEAPVMERSGSGCAQNGETINAADYRVITPNAWLPWNYDIHNISQAWNYSTGAGITVGLIDTGISSNQSLLGSGFNDGASNGRTVERFGTFIDSPWFWSTKTDGPNDKCGHGTSMASAIASPRNDDFMPVGVAYNANLVSYRGTEDVVLNDYHEKKGVSNALKALGNRSNVKIISMSVGYPWSIGNVKDAVRYAYSKGKMIIAAGGTSTTFTNWYGVIFPASMSETVAVTGLKDNGYRLCDICHDGNKIDFTMVMERSSGSRKNVPVIGFNSGDRSYVGGSSVATAMTAGAAALVWATNPSMTRDQVLDKLKRAGEFYPNRNGDFGYGNIDVLKAVQ
ncbi:S8/S53 family peptidase [Aquimarina intermedia]|uniref:Subtilisin family serine protease n=1 Tax=Aquimarina intermedia TaxID=350814 RepID=A0A5S5BY22_9FLAO|nr:S8/S53 family peptidase [Aquimarina intermedia]TYP71030.1 subtilisin family serine protease [Aquimarina intermedia]